MANARCGDVCPGCQGGAETEGGGEDETEGGDETDTHTVQETSATGGLPPICLILRLILPLIIRFIIFSSSHHPSHPLTLPLILLPSQHLYDTTIIWPIVSSLLGVIFVEDFLVYIAMSFSVVCVWAATCSVTVTISLQGSVAAADADVRS